ncbi:hypothetical protein RhiirA4_468869, partial [Rhizophagus irregularis]
LENVESANKSWFEEGKFHLSISNKYSHIVKCFGITKDPSDKNYMLVMYKLNNNLREYLHQNHNKLTWKRRIQIINNIVFGVSKIHEENAIHRDLHSGNILFSKTNIRISDLGFCGPADKPLNSIYGNLPYIAPEVIGKMKYSFASDVYSIELMEQCWDADPTKRPDIDTLYDEMESLYRSYLNNENDEQQTNTSIDNFQLNINISISSTNSINSFFRNSSSRIYYFKDLPEPRNATKEEQEVYHSIQFDFDLQDGIITEVKEEFNKRSYFNVEGQDDLTINPKKVRLNNNNYKGYLKLDDDKIYNPNFHLEEQDELKVSDLLITTSSKQLLIENEVVSIPTILLNNKSLFNYISFSSQISTYLIDKMRHAFIKILQIIYGIQLDNEIAFILIPWSNGASTCFSQLHILNIDLFVGLTSKNYWKWQNIEVLEILDFDKANPGLIKFIDNQKNLRSLTLRQALLLPKFFSSLTNLIYLEFISSYYNNNEKELQELQRLPYICFKWFCILLQELLKILMSEISSLKLWTIIQDMTSIIIFFISGTKVYGLTDLISSQNNLKSVTFESSYYENDYKVKLIIPSLTKFSLTSTKLILDEYYILLSFVAMFTNLQALQQIHFSQLKILNHSQKPKCLLDF